MAKIATNAEWACIPEQSWKPVEVQWKLVEKKANECEYTMQLLTMGLAEAKKTIDEASRPEFYTAVLSMKGDIDLLNQRCDLLKNIQELHVNMAGGVAA